MFLLAIAAQMSLPISSGIADVRELFSYTDFPRYLVEGGEDVSKTVYTRTTVRSDGSTESCVAEGSSGDLRLDAYTCALIVKRAKFRPAKWIDGSNVYGVIRTPISWRMRYAYSSDEDPWKSVVPDLELSVSQLPKETHAIAGVTIELAADENGHLVACQEAPLRKNDRAKHFPEFTKAACEQAAKSISIKPPVDLAGKPTRSVQNGLSRLQA